MKTVRPRGRNSIKTAIEREKRPLDSIGRFELPIIKDQNISLPQKLIGLNEALYSRNPDLTASVHCFISDSVLDRLWSDFERNAEKLARFPSVFSPDYSMMMDSLFPEKFNSIYRSRVVAQMLQRRGIKVIPTMQWATPDTYEFCFAGIPKHGIVAVSTIGTFRRDFARQAFQDGFREMMVRLAPASVILYGRFPQWCDFGDANLICFENTHLAWTRNPQLYLEEVV